MKNDNIKNIDNIKNRLQFLVILFLFFPTIFSKSEELMLKWVISIAVIVIIYLLLELIGESLRPLISKVVNILTLVSISLFIPMFILLSNFDKFTNINSYKNLFTINLKALLYVPLVIAFLLSVNLYIKIGNKV